MTQYNMDPDKGGIKHDGDKTQWHLLPFEAIEGAVHVLMYGATKYAAYNWAKGMPYTRVLDAAVRHINAIYQGEDLDDDSGMAHVDHALCELIFLKYYMLHHMGIDDRFRREAIDMRSGSGIGQTNTAQDKSSIGFKLAKEQQEFDFSHEDAEGDPDYWGV